MNLAALSIAELTQLLAKGELSAREIALHTLSAISQHNPELNAWTQITQERMLQEADRVDRLKQGNLPLPPLAAVPYAVKNLFDVAGHATLAGASLFSDRPVACQDAWAVQKLAAGGGLLSGMLNMDAYAYGFTTENSHYGATRNPHDLARIAGDRRVGRPPPWPPGWSISPSVRIPTARSAFRPHCAESLV
ncbi:hypothetical protein ERHA54_09460 [Erwinia rhapontici]|nr:hypothetical protein ERHA54_09460 [Erwinia rhapontici]BCQ43482.1 hypothetical protein ERHA55_10090 [Erwinia rhapontici]